VGEDKILKTTDGSESWFSQSQTQASLMSVHFISENTGGVIGWNGKIIKTANGGENWEIKYSYFSNKIRSAFFISDSIGWVAGGVASGCPDLFIKIYFFKNLLNCT